MDRVFRESERGAWLREKEKTWSGWHGGEGYGRHSETVERGMDGRTDGRMDGPGRGEKRERERRLGGAAARRPAANCQTTPAVPQAILRPRRRRPPP